MLRFTRALFAAPKPPGLVYDPPANQLDFNKQGTYTEWSNQTQAFFTKSIWQTPAHGEAADGLNGIAYRLPGARDLSNNYKSADGTPIMNYKSTLQFREPADLDAMAKYSKQETATALITWTGFPKDLQQFQDKYEDAEKSWAHWKVIQKITRYGKYWYDGLARCMDEYCEWDSFKNSDGKITQLSITCEGPEYWSLLTSEEPDVALALYQQYVGNPRGVTIEMDDLLKGGVYNPYNKWNVTTPEGEDLYGVRGGAMHLNCPPNSLYAEAYIAAEACTRWEGPNDNILTDAQDLVNCAQYGVGSRASDPHIGDRVNTLVRGNALVSLANPVGLYFKDLYTDGLMSPDFQPFTAEEIKEVVTYARGNGQSGEDAQHLRIVLEIPSSWGYTLSDCYLGGSPINYAGQLIESMVTVFLNGYALPNGSQFLSKPADQMPAVPCKSTWVKNDQGSAMYPQNVEDPGAVDYWPTS